MNSIEIRTLNALRLIASGKVRWSTSGHRVRFEYVQDGDWRADYSIDCSGVAGLSEALYERDGWRSKDHGRVALTDKGRELLVELDAEP